MTVSITKDELDLIHYWIVNEDKADNQELAAGLKAKLERAFIRDMMSKNR